MQQVSKPQANQKRNGSLSSLFLLAGLTLMGVITLGSVATESVRALQSGSTQAANRNSWQAGSFPVENFQAYTSPFGYRRSATGGSGTVGGVVRFWRFLTILPAAPQSRSNRERGLMSTAI